MLRPWGHSKRVQNRLHPDADFMILEVIMETVIPLLMSSIIDDGVEAGNMQHIYQVGA